MSEELGILSLEKKFGCVFEVLSKALSERAKADAGEEVDREAGILHAIPREYSLEEGLDGLVCKLLEEWLVA